MTDYIFNERCPFCNSPKVRMIEETAPVFYDDDVNGFIYEGWRCEQCQSYFEVRATLHVSYRSYNSRIFEEGEGNETSIRSNFDKMVQNSMKLTEQFREWGVKYD